MTDTKPDYAKMIDLINVLAVDRECDEGHDAKETCDKSAEAIRTLLESNKALVRERTNLIKTKREQIGRLNTRIAELEREREELKHDLERYISIASEEATHAEDAEARLAEALKALAEVRRRARNIWGACSSDQIIDKDVERQAKLMLEYIDAARACLEKGNSDGE